MACGYEMDTDGFKNYCMVTAELYVKKYEWYYMPQSLHNILLHEALLINTAILSISQIPKENSGRRKHEYNVQKFSKKQIMENMMHMLLIS